MKKKGKKVLGARGEGNVNIVLLVFVFVLFASLVGYVFMNENFLSPSFSPEGTEFIEQDWRIFCL